MKIPFDIKFRPQIESGEYKVVTGDDRPVRIISWDKKVYGGRYEIVALVPTSQGDTETVQLYCPDGTLLSSSYNEKFKLFIVTPEPELTEFEKLFSELIADVHGAIVPLNMDEVKESCQKLMELAKKELCNRCSKCLDEYWRGRKEAMEEVSKGFHYEGPTVPNFWPSCPHGGVCTNPFHDCINCRPQSTIGINTATGTSTSKVEG